MILAIDMGNTNIKIGLVDGESVIEERVQTNHDKTSLEYATDIISVLNLYGKAASDFDGAIVSSVVPPLTPVLSAAVNKVLKIRPVIVDGNCKYRFSPPEDVPVGADILAAAEGVIGVYDLPCIMVNLGTATTYMLLDKDGRLRGGMILPGMKTSLSALSSGTSILPEISLDEPGSTISKNTEECMRSGIMYGYAAQVDGLIEKMEDELGEKCSVVSTGGMARFCIPLCKRKIKIDNDLIMRGLNSIYYSNKQP